MIQSKEDFLEYLSCDAKALGCKEKKFPVGGTRYYIWRYQVLLRTLEYYTNCRQEVYLKPYKLYLKWKFRQLSIKYGFEIPINTFGKGLSIGHIGTIVINGAVKIGDNCRIHTCVNIGTEAGYADRAPNIGDNVYIGPGAKIFGDIKIADGIAIGANSVVNKSFTENNISIAGVPAKKISSKGTSRLGGD